MVKLKFGTYITVFRQQKKLFFLINEFEKLKISIIKKMILFSMKYGKFIK